MNATIKEPIGISLIKSTFIALGLILFNLIFVLGIYLGVWGIIIGLFASGVAFIFSGIVFIFAALVSSPIVFSIPMVLIQHPILLVSGGLLGIGGGGLLFFGLLWLTKYYLDGTMRYIRWQMKLIRGY